MLTLISLLVILLPGLHEAESQDLLQLTKLSSDDTAYHTITERKLHRSRRKSMYGKSKGKGKKKFKSRDKSKSSKYTKKSRSKKNWYQNCYLIAKFHTDDVEGYIAARYLSEETADFQIKLDLGSFQPTNTSGIEIEVGTELDWHLHVKWDGNYGDSGANDQCENSSTGGHYDPTVACSSASEYIGNDGMCYGPNGKVVDSYNYDCDPWSDFETECERGDQSGKLGLLRVQTLRRSGERAIRFRGIDQFFAEQYVVASNEAHNWSFVIHLHGTRVLCARAEYYCR